MLGRWPGLYQWVCKRVFPKDALAALGSAKYMSNPYLLKEYQEDIKGHNVISAVHMPYIWKVKSDIELAGETRFVEKIFSNSEQSRHVDLAAIVGNANLENVAQLQTLINYHKKESDRFVGIRGMLAWSDDPGVCNFAHEKNITKNKNWLQGFKLLEQNNLSFDVWGYHSQLPEIISLAKSFPNTSIILDHMGTPIGALGAFAGYGRSQGDRDAIIKEWQEGMFELAKNKNVVVKISGLFMPMLGWDLHNRKSLPTLSEIVNKLQPLIDFTINTFGVERCMFGSHFAPDKVSISYRLLYDAYKEIVKNRSEEEQNMLFSGTAKKAYKI